MTARSNSNELRLTRVYDAPVKTVWDAWTDLEQVSQWWGPRGFTITTESKDLRPGGTWRYTMHGPDGTDYPNITLYHVVERHKKLVYDHGATDKTPPLFRVTVTFEETDGKTTMDMVFSLATPEVAQQTAKFIKRARGESTWDRLAEHLDQQRGARARFFLNRSFEAPIERVFAAWTRPEQLEQWLAPAGCTMKFLRATLGPGESTLFALTGEHGTTHVRATYEVLEAPRRIVYTQQFVDADERPAKAPGADVWPATLRNTVLFTAEGPDRTRVTLTTEPVGEITAAEREAFLAERSGMTHGWSGSLDVLDERFENEAASG